MTRISLLWNLLFKLGCIIWGLWILEGLWANFSKIMKCFYVRKSVENVKRMSFFFLWRRGFIVFC